MFDDESLECAHVSINEVACHRPERALEGCADPYVGGGSEHASSVLELIKNEVDGVVTGWSDTMNTDLKPIPLQPIVFSSALLVLVPRLHRAATSRSENPSSLF